MSRVQKLFVLLLSMVVAACDPSSRSAAKQIGSEGGVVHGMLDDGIKVTLTIPKGAVKVNTPFTLTLKDPEEIGLSDSFPVAGGYVMELGPNGAAFDKRPVLLEVAPTDEDDAKKPRGRLYYRNVAKHLWEPVDVARIDRKTGSITYRLEHFSTYALLNANVRVDYINLDDPIVPGEAFSVDVGLTHLGQSGWFTQFMNKDEGTAVTVHAYLHAKGEELKPGDALSGSFNVPFGEQNQVWPDVPGGPAHEAGTVMVLEILADISGSSDKWVVFERDLLSDLANATLTGSYPSSQELLKAYAPVFEFAPGESYRPVSVDYILRHAEEFILEDPVWGKDSLKEERVTWSVLPGLSEAERRQRRAELLAKHGSSRSYVDFDGAGSQFAVGPGGVQDSDLVIYGRATEHDLGTAFGGIGDALVLSYFLIFPYDVKLGTGMAHTGDRESVAVVLDIVNGNIAPEPIAVAFGQHLDGHYMEAEFGIDTIGWRGDVLTLSWAQVDSIGNHVVGYIAEGTHAVYPRRGAKRVIVNLGTVAWFEDVHLNAEEEAGGGTSWIVPEDVPLVGGVRATYQVVEAPSLQAVSASTADWNWMLYPGALVRGEMLGADIGVFGNVPIIPFINRWYEPHAWVLGGRTAYTSSLAHGLGTKRPGGAVHYHDVSTGAWFRKAVVTLSRIGVISGDAGSQSFRPGDDVNRAEFLKMVIAARDATGTSLANEISASENFSDVSVADWYYDHVVLAVQHGIIDNGTASNNYLFRPGDSLNRAEATKMVVEAFGLTGPVSPGDNFSDVSSGSWYESYVRIAAKHGVVEGYDDGTFKPSNNINRAEAAAIVWRAYKRGAN